MDRKSQPSPSSQKLQKLRIGEIGLIKSFIHYVHFHEEINPISNDWKSITMDDFDQFRSKATYTRKFASLSSLLPLDMMYVDDTSVNMQKIGSKPEPSKPLKDNIFNDKQNDSFENPPRALDKRCDRYY
jgi:hypothetical protein